MKKNIKKDKVENISEYNKHKEYCTLTKPKSYQSVKIVEDLNDSWFLYVITYKTKSGEITDTSMIIGSDYASRLDHLKQVGWECKK